MVFFVKLKLCWVVHQRNSVLASNYFQVEWLHMNNDYKRSLEQVLEDHVIKAAKISNTSILHVTKIHEKIVSNQFILYTNFGMCGDVSGWPKGISHTTKETGMELNWKHYIYLIMILKIACGCFEFIVIKVR